MARLLLALLCGSASLWAVAGGGGGDAELRNGRCEALMHIKNAMAEDTGRMEIRYTCVKGYKRKAGTSSLVGCKKNETTNIYGWKSNLNCIRDPSLPEPVPTTEDTRKDTETPTPTSQPVPPKTSANPAAVSGDPYGSETTRPPEPSVDTTLPTTAKPSPEESTAMDVPREIGGGVSGTDCKNVTPHKGTTTQESQSDSSKPSFSSTPSTETSSTTAVPPRNSPANTTGVSEADVPQGQTGFSRLQAVLLPIVFILLPFTIAGLWYYYRKRSRFRRQRDIIVMQEIPVTERSGERGPMLSAGEDTEDTGPAHEETPMQPSDSSASTG